MPLQASLSIRCISVFCFSVTATGEDSFVQKSNRAYILRTLRENISVGTGEMASWVKAERIFTMGTGEMASWVKALVSKPDDPS